MSETTRYFDLRTPAPQRLAMLRAAFANHAARYPHCHEHAKPASWRDIRGTTYKGVRAYMGGLDQGFNGEGAAAVPVWYCHTGPQFRDERFAHECEGGPSHTGWHTNSDGETFRDGSGLARGIVGRLTHGRFIAGYWWGDNGERVYFPEVFTDEADAAAMADEHARVFAEKACEDSARYDEARDIEEATETALQRLRECLALRHRACMSYVRDEVRELARTIKENRARLAGELADYV